MDQYICPHCGNDKYFYYEVSVVARQKFNNKTGNDVGKPYKVNKDNIDTTYHHIYCWECDGIVADESDYGE